MRASFSRLSCLGVQHSSFMLLKRVLAGEAVIMKSVVGLVGEGFFPLGDLQPLAYFIYHIWA